MNAWAPKLAFSGPAPSGSLGFQSCDVKKCCFASRSAAHASFVVLTAMRASTARTSNPAPRASQRNRRSPIAPRSRAVRASPGPVGSSTSAVVTGPRRPDSAGRDLVELGERLGGDRVRQLGVVDVGGLALAVRQHVLDPALHQRALG